MDITLHLILAHFLADFPLQTNRMVAYKTKHFAGIVLHSLVHVLTSVLLSFPFLFQARLWMAIGVVFVTHNILDATKVWAAKRFPKFNAFWLYILDQIGHLAIILASSWLWLGFMKPDFSGPWLNVYNDLPLLSFVLVLILVTYFYDVTRWTWRNAKKPQPYIRDWAMMGRNALIVVVAFGVYWFN